MASLTACRIKSARFRFAAGAIRSVAFRVSSSKCIRIWDISIIYVVALHIALIHEVLVPGRMMQAAFIVDNEFLPPSHMAFPFMMGSAKKNVVPDASLLITQTRPWWDSATFLVIESPNPVPGARCSVPEPR